MQVVQAALVIYGAYTGGKMLIEGFKEGDIGQAILGGLTVFASVAGGASMLNKVGEHATGQALGVAGTDIMNMADAIKPATEVLSGGSEAAAGAQQALGKLPTATAPIDPTAVTKMATSGEIPALPSASEGLKPSSLLGNAGSAPLSIADTASIGTTQGAAGMQPQGFFKQMQFGDALGLPEQGGLFKPMQAVPKKGLLGLGESLGLNDFTADFNGIIDWIENNETTATMLGQMITGYSNQKFAEDYLDRQEEWARETRRLRGGTPTMPLRTPPKERFA